MNIQVGNRVAVKTGVPLHVISGAVTEISDDKYFPYLVRLDVPWNNDSEIWFSESDIVYIAR
jgi:hypothetical protein